ncbi:hypothetical protein AOL_s00215g569 [Orbilia oligospora ATCC 24927]|uniref:DUF2423 domain-containing protein n=1 Tax=Arthrobotrys oligospora (strain ATCC 24927 / CBS 115.81 / DSM 1491) TaxID=756982 RepID=G1XT71_ARTOA|nr:hypothetical protein AOL_s00215g569 [Orbilia oligospora ATCC 24927]EGX43833.1 hypothetical protein AOL_s00215g569 [Orbilia oligospora ATCC 24927]
MAKSARASTKKASRSRIRNNVYAPVEQARLERLSARLMAIAQPSTSRTTTGGDHMDEDGKSPLPIHSSSPSSSSYHRSFGRNNSSDRYRCRKSAEAKRQWKLLTRVLPAASAVDAIHSAVHNRSANSVAADIDLADATTRQEQHTEDQAFKAAQQGNLFFDLPLPLSLVDEDSSGDESEDDAFYRAIGLFGDIQGFGMDNTLRVCLT